MTLPRPRKQDRHRNVTGAYAQPKDRQTSLSAKNPIRYEKNVATNSRNRIKKRLSKNTKLNIQKQTFNSNL